MYWSVKGTPYREEGTHRAKLRSPAEHMHALQWSQAELSGLLLPQPILICLGFPMSGSISSEQRWEERVAPHITQVRDGGN